MTNETLRKTSWPKRALVLLLAIAATSFGLVVFGQEQFRVATADLPSTLDPPGSASNTGIRVQPSIFETLIHMDSEDNSILEPALATSWRRVSDTVLELTLREGVKFHNGDPFTAEDVKFSIDRILAVDSTFTLPKSLLATVDNVEIIDDHTVQIITSAPDPILEYRLASVFGSWIVPASYVQEIGPEAFGRQPVGTGPFQVTSYRPDRITLTRFDDYWGEKPVVETLEFREMPEVASRITALVNGEVDLITQVPVDQAAVIDRYDGVEAKSREIANIHLLVVNTFQSPTDDPLLRQALRLGIDRDLLAAALWDGRVTVPHSHQYDNFGDMLDRDRPSEPYDPEEARRLVEASSYAGQELIYNTRGGYYTNEVEAAQAIVEMWRAIGVNARVRIVDTSAAYDGDPNLVTWSNSERFPDPLGGLWLLWGEESSRQTGADVTWTPESERFNELGHMLESSTDQAERFEGFKEMLDIFDAEVPSILLYYPAETWGVRSDWDWAPFPSHVLEFGPEYLRRAE